MRKHGFGARLRENRLRHGISLRKLAELIDVSPTYLSQVEQGKFAPPTANRMARVAEVFGDDADHWIGLAGRIPEDLEPIIRQHSTTMPELIRLAGQISDLEMVELIHDLQRRMACQPELVEAQ